MGSDVPIKVDVTRSGGYAGIEMRAAVDTEHLPAQSAAQIRSLVQRLDPAALGGQIGQTPAQGTTERSIRSSPATDRFQYDVEIQVGDDVHRFTVGETAVPSGLQSLLDAVMTHGQNG